MTTNWEEIYSLPVLEAGSPTSRCGQGWAPSGGSRGRSFLPLPASGGPWLSLAVAALVSVSVYMWLLLSPVKSSVVT